MSKVAIQGNASGTGVFTIASPNSNTDRVITLPDEAGTVDTLQRAGNVIQVVHYALTTEFSTTATTYTDTGLAASITPSSASNKVLVSVQAPLQMVLSTVSAQYAGTQLLRNSTIIRTSVADINGPYEFAVTGTDFGSGTAAYNVLDNPATTSSITYKVQARAYTTTNLSAFYVARSGTTAQNPAYITLMEIAA